MPETYLDQSPRSGKLSQVSPRDRALHEVARALPHRRGIHVPRLGLHFSGSPGGGNQAEMIVRNRLQRLQGAVDETIKVVKIKSRNLGEIP